MKGKELVKLLKKNGWTVDRMHGSHCVMKKGRQTETIPVHNIDLPPGLLQQLKNGPGLDSPPGLERT